MSPGIYLVIGMLVGGISAVLGMALAMWHTHGKPKILARVHNVELWMDELSSTMTILIKKEHEDDESHTLTYRMATDVLYQWVVENVPR